MTTQAVLLLQHSSTITQKGGLENVLSSWVVNGKEVESHLKLLPELNAVSEGSSECH